MLSEEDFNAWVAHPVTQEMRKLFSARRAQYREAWEGGHFSTLMQPDYPIRNAAAIGECKGLAFFSELSYEDYLVEKDDGEQIGASTPREGGTRAAV